MMMMMTGWLPPPVAGVPQIQPAREVCVIHARARREYLLPLCHRERCERPRGDQIAVFSSLGLHWSSPESGELWYESGGVKETIWSGSGDPAEALYLALARLESSFTKYASPAHQIVFDSSLGLHWSSPESGELWYESEEGKETIWYRSGDPVVVLALALARLKSSFVK